LSIKPDFQISNVTVTSPAWMPENINIPGRGTFLRQVEAVSRTHADLFPGGKDGIFHRRLLLNAKI